MNKNERKSKKIKENEWKSIKMNENELKWIKMNGNDWKLMKINKKRIYKNVIWIKKMIFIYIIYKYYQHKKQ